MVGDAEIGEDEAGGQLGGRLLDGQDIAAEALVEIAVETMLRPRAVSSFMNQRPIVSCGLVESLASNGGMKMWSRSIRSWAS